MLPLLPLPQFAAVQGNLSSCISVSVSPFYLSNSFFFFLYDVSGMWDPERGLKTALESGIQRPSIEVLSGLGDFQSAFPLFFFYCI